MAPGDDDGYEDDDLDEAAAQKRKSVELMKRLEEAAEGIEGEGGAFIKKKKKTGRSSPTLTGKPGSMRSASRAESMTGSTWGGSTLGGSHKSEKSGKSGSDDKSAGPGMNGLNILSKKDRMERKQLRKATANLAEEPLSPTAAAPKGVLKGKAPCVTTAL